MLLGVIAVLVFGFVVMKLWNGILPDVLHVSPISFWQALGILVLSKILFGGFRGGGGYKQRWKMKMEEKWQQMTPEERQHWKEEMRNRCRTWKRTAPEAGSATTTGEA
jgi:Ca2+/H+ antiporter, TMEM165/GDT1 family